MLLKGSLAETWSLQFEHPIIAFTTHESTFNEHIYTTLVQYGNDILYKYLNPNLFAIAMLNDKDPENKVLEIFIVDSITGTIIYRSSHDSCEGPVHLLLDENVLLYHYHNTKPNRYQLSVLELYSNNSMSDANIMERLFTTESSKSHVKSYSTYALGRPYVKRQSFIFPYAVRALASTKTTLGITSKHFLCKSFMIVIYINVYSRSCKRSSYVSKSKVPRHEKA